MPACRRTSAPSPRSGGWLLVQELCSLPCLRTHSSDAAACLSPLARVQGLELMQRRPLDFVVAASSSFLVNLFCYLSIKHVSATSFKAAGEQATTAEHSMQQRQEKAEQTSVWPQRCAGAKDSQECSSFAASLPSLPRLVSMQAA